MNSSALPEAGQDVISHVTPCPCSWPLLTLHYPQITKGSFQSQNATRPCPHLLFLDTTNTWGEIVSCCGAVLCIGRCWQQYLGSTQ